jgi:CBS domain-containing protein
MQAIDVMARDVVTVSPGSTIDELAQIMADGMIRDRLRAELHE